MPSDTSALQKHPGVCSAMLDLAGLIEAAAKHPLYREWDCSRIQALGDARWCQLPTLTSEQLRNYQIKSGGEEQIVFYSSGTTGAPKLVSYSQVDLGRVGELCARFARLEGVTERSRVMVLLPMGLWTVGKITVDGHRLAGAEVFPVDLHGGIEAWQRMADLIRPTVISSTPSIMAAWAASYKGPKLELVETTGEPLLTSERHRIEASFGAFVHDAYGLSECVVGTECSARNGFHYWPDATHVDVIDPRSDKPLPEGETGELTLTSLMQEHMPVIRYRSGDLGRIDRSPCVCGHIGPRVHLEGRIAPTLTMPRAVKIDATELSELISSQAKGAHFRYKGTPGSPATPFVSGQFRPVLEISLPGKAIAMQVQLRNEIFASYPELSELVMEKELELCFQ